MYIAIVILTLQLWLLFCYLTTVYMYMTCRVYLDKLWTNYDKTKFSKKSTVHGEMGSSKTVHTCTCIAKMRVIAFYMYMYNTQYSTHVCGHLYRQ